LKKMVGIDNMAVVGPELAIRWQDGVEAYIPLARLRESCPCASCQGEPDALGRVVRPERPVGSGSEQLRGYEFIGGYAVQLSWSDGHNTGIYSYDYLRRLGGDGIS
jgi:DUF971 family protein